MSSFISLWGNFTMLHPRRAHPSGARQGCCFDLQQTPFALWLNHHK